MPTPYHEPYEELSPQTRETHRAIASLIEEWEAADWYQNRLDATDNEELHAILLHNRNEEIEHAAMLLEWLRRNVPEVDKQLRTYLFTEAPITEVEEEEEGEGGDGEGQSPPSLGIGKT
jgi:hypothetical protein